MAASCHSSSRILALDYSERQLPTLSCRSSIMKIAATVVVELGRLVWQDAEHIMICLFSSLLYGGFAFS